MADFGTTRQEFHIGMGAIATPGTIDGLVRIHSDLGSLPLREVLSPAIGYAAEGVRINSLQAYIFSIVEPIYLSTPAARSIYGSQDGADALHGEGTLFRQPQLADSLRQIAEEGAAPFYRGQHAMQLARDSRENGGHLDRKDLAGFSTLLRRPLEYPYRGWQVATNPAPSSGGMLIAFAQQLLARADLGLSSFGSMEHLTLLAEVMAQANLARTAHGTALQALDEALLQRYRSAIAGHPLCTRGTTHISVIDHAGNAASLTLSNGEGSGYVLPGTGIMLNNMLGEEDLNPAGFGRWDTNVRVSSMMAPTITRNGARLIALGSGGSNRLRTAILQALVNLIDFDMQPQAAVFAPRIHFEQGHLHIEPGFDEGTLAGLQRHYPDATHWPEMNLYFGGTHTVMWDGKQFSGCGDPRRGGVFLVQT
jgi:gamma-glutamyltranspeptidase/glutathione hydrolase